VDFIMMMKKKDWRPSAAYAYLLHLDGPALAWEYLRRNTDYQRDWECYGEADPANKASQQWGCRYFENPALDAREARPSWRSDPPSTVRVIADPDPDAVSAPGFCLWSVPGRKTMVHDGARLLLTSEVARGRLRLAIGEGVEAGRPFAYAICAHTRARASWNAISHLTHVLARPAAWKASSAPSRPSRGALWHMRALQALDGACAQATHREIAIALFGAERVACSWQPGSDLRSQVRHLIHRSTALMRGEYRSVLGQPGLSIYPRPAHAGRLIAGGR
jgi:hypothetical protein